MMTMISTATKNVATGTVEVRHCITLYCVVLCYITQQISNFNIKVNVKIEIKMKYIVLKTIYTYVQYNHVTLQYLYSDIPLYNCIPFRDRKART